MSELILERDEKGRIVRSGLTPEKAREMSKLGQEAQRGRTVTVPGLLDQFGYDDSNPAPAHIALLAQAAVKSSNPVTALRELMTQVTQPGAASQQAKPEPGTICPTCGQLCADLDGLVLLRLLEILHSLQPEELPGLVQGEGHRAPGATAPEPRRSAAPTRSTHQNMTGEEEARGAGALPATEATDEPGPTEVIYHD
jgi:hypothetical protein